MHIKLLYESKNLTVNCFNFIFIVELAMILDRLYGGVCYAGIDTDPELKYPKVIIAFCLVNSMQ